VFAEFDLAQADLSVAALCLPLLFRKTKGFSFDAHGLSLGFFSLSVISEIKPPVFFSLDRMRAR